MTPEAAARTTARAALLDIIGAHLDAGHRIPCVTSAAWAAWTSDDPAVQARAATACTTCPARAACAAYVAAHPGESGVYSGSTDADRPTRRRAHRAAAA